VSERYYGAEDHSILVKTLDPVDEAGVELDCIDRQMPTFVLMTGAREPDDNSL